MPVLVLFVMGAIAGSGAYVGSSVTGYVHEKAKEAIETIKAMKAVKAN